MTYGVPQGSVLGPTLFLIYINQLCKLPIENGSIFAYADDTAVVFYGDSWEEVRISAELGLAKISRWLQTNLLTLNLDKTNYICFTKYNRTQPNPSFKIRIHNCREPIQPSCSCSTINKVEAIKYLGVMIDQRLTWHTHTELIMSRIRKLIWTFKSLRHVVTKKLLNQIYITLAQSVLVYCIPIWGGATKTKFLQLERAQRALLKVMYFKPYRFPTSDLYQLCDLMTIRKLYVLNVILRRHKSTKLCPNIITTSIRRRRKPNVIPMPDTKSVFARRQYLAQSTKLYNLINKTEDIYPSTYKDCKTKVLKWIKTKNYAELENMLVN